MKKLCLITLLVVVVLAVAARANQDQVAIQPGPVDGQDVWITSFYDYGSNYGVDNEWLQAGGWGDQYCFLIKFDLKGLPAGG